MMHITAHALMDSSESTVRKKVFQFRFNFPSKPGFRIFFYYYLSAWKVRVIPKSLSSKFEE